MLFAAQIAPINVIDDGNDDNDSGKGCDPCHDLGKNGFFAEGHFAGQPKADLCAASAEQFHKTLFEEKQKNDKKGAYDQFRDQRSQGKALGGKGSGDGGGLQE